MIVVDTSALLAVIFDQPDSNRCAKALQEDADVHISGGTLAEALIVTSHRGGIDETLALIRELGIAVTPVDAAEAARAAQAHAKWGKGVHPAGLNFGDCFAYALAKKLDCPLLFIGNDFSKTDLTDVLA